MTDAGTVYYANVQNVQLPQSLVLAEVLWIQNG